MSRFFKPVCVSLILTSAVLAEDPAPSVAEKKEKKPKLGYLRFWNLLPKAEGNLILAKGDGTPQGEILSTAIPLNNYAGYNALPAARYTFNVSRAADPTKTVQSFDVVMRDDVFVTILGTLSNGQVKVELIDDTFDPTTTVTGRVTIRHQFPGLRVVIAGGRQTSRPLSAGETEIMDGFPKSFVSFQMVATRPNGKVENWSADIDFSKVPHASLVVVPDPYGRFRPRVSVDGNPVSEIPAGN